MALKRMYSEGTKFSYVRINFIHFHKEEVVNISVSIWEKDDADPEYVIEKNNLSFRYTASKEWFSDYFSIAILDQESSNIVKQAYICLKDKEDLFRDFIDC